MPIPTSFTDLSTTAASNSPAGGDTPAEGDNHIRTIYAFLRSIFSNSGNGWTSPYVASSSLPTLTSGTYTPTLTNVSNIDSSTANVCQYQRVGSIVTVFGSASVDASAAASFSLGVSLPIASNFAAATDANGVAAYSNVGSDGGGRISADTTNDRVTLVCISPSTSAITFYFSFSYTVI